MSWAIFPRPYSMCDVNSLVSNIPHGFFFLHTKTQFNGGIKTLKVGAGGVGGEEEYRGTREERRGDRKQKRLAQECSAQYCSFLYLPSLLINIQVSTKFSNRTKNSLKWVASRN